MNMLLGMKIIVSQHATELVTNWPEKRRSKRLVKKMTKKRGPQFSVKPTAYQVGGTMIVHPSILAALRAKAKEVDHG